VLASAVMYLPLGVSPTTGTQMPGNPIASVPLVLHSPIYTESVLGAKIILPETTSLGQSFKVVGVRINTPPTNMTYTTIDGQAKTFTYWSVTLFVWNQAFVNGTTNLTIFNSGGIAIVETSAPPGGNSSASAQEQTSPPTACMTGTNGTSCRTGYSPEQAYITKSNGLSIVVSPVTNQLSWLDDKRNLWVNVVGGTVPMSELLELANSLTA